MQHHTPVVQMLKFGDSNLNEIIYQLTETII